MKNDTHDSDVRAMALSRLAEDHGVSPRARTSTGEALSRHLAAPGRLGRWCAVTYSAAEQSACLYPRSENAADAREFAEALLADPSLTELPVEIVDLDTGDRLIARLAVVAWDRVPCPDRRIS